MKTRDSRKQKLYEAEFDLRRTVDPIVFATAGEMYAYITKLIRSAWFRRRWPNVSIPSVVLGRGSHYVWGQIVIARQWGRTEIVLLHELAHHIITQTQWGVASHGREFAAVMLQLVRYQMGADKERLLREAYVKHGVKYRAKRKLSPATLAKMRERGKQLAKQHFHKEGQ